MSDYIPTPNIIIEPLDPLVQEAVQAILASDPNYFSQVEKVVVRPGLGNGTLGFVESGPGKNPRIIYIYKDRIQNIISQHFQGDINSDTFSDAVKLAIIEVLGHEKTHIGENPEEGFLGEPEAESGGRQLRERFGFLNNVILSSKIHLYAIQKKYFNKVTNIEPTIDFLLTVAKNNKYDIIKKSFEILSPRTNIKSKIAEIKSFNNIILSRNMKKLGEILNVLQIKEYNENDLILHLAKFQTENDLFVSGKLDENTFNKIAKTFNFNNLPKNFGVVIPKSLYRGALINNIEELKSLKEMCGIERVVSLHKTKSVPLFCKLLNIEYVPAYMEKGAPDEHGRKVLGDSVLEYLIEKPTYVHCFYGKDRTGGVIARCRTESGWPCHLAYLEAKSYGFEDSFVDLIKWFCEYNNETPPINIEQFILEPTPNDMPFSSPFEIANNSNYTTWADTVNNITPMSITSPVPIGSNIV